MKRRFILYRRKRGGVFYLEDIETRKQESLGTKNRAEAMTLLTARNESVQQPQMNLHIGQTYLAASDPEATNGRGRFRSKNSPRPSRASPTTAGYACSKTRRSL